MRVWGEDAALLRAAGADVPALAALEQGLEAGIAGLPRAGAIDAHVHIGRDADGHAIDAAALVADLDRWGLAAAVCFPANEPGADGCFAEANARVREAARLHPGRIIPFCRVDPMRDGARAEIAASAADGARGLKLHPVAQRFRPEAPAVVGVVRDAAERGWPVTIHAGYGARELAGAIRAPVGAAPGPGRCPAHASCWRT